MPYDFTLRTYGELCQTVSIVQKDCRFLHHLEHRDDSRIILRHDVDRKPENALRMAKLEHELGVRSTYYFRCVPVSFDANMIRQISEMGHEIGFHYEVMSKAGGEMKEAKRIFLEDLERLRSICEVRTACMHGSPGSRYNNLRFWDDNRPEEFGLDGSAYLSASNISAYFTDTGGSWNSPHNIRDKLVGCEMPKVSSTLELINILNVQNYKTVYITCHPERWAEKWVEGVQYSTFDVACNAAKKMVRMFS